MGGVIRSRFTEARARMSVYLVDARARRAPRCSVRLDIDFSASARRLPPHLGAASCGWHGRRYWLGWTCVGRASVIRLACASTEHGAGGSSGAGPSPGSRLLPICWVSMSCSASGQPGNASGTERSQTRHPRVAARARAAGAAVMLDLADGSEQLTSRMSGSGRPCSDFITWVRTHGRTPPWLRSGAKPACGTCLKSSIAMPLVKTRSRSSRPALAAFMTAGEGPRHREITRL